MDLGYYVLYLHHGFGNKRIVRLERTINEYLERAQTENEMKTETLTELLKVRYGIDVQKEINLIPMQQLIMYGKEYIRYYYNKLAELNGSINSTCNCQRNSNPRDNEPCCKCDSRQTNADRIRNMSDEELAELITGSLNFDCADYCDSFMNGCAFKCGKKDREIALKWLQSEAE